ncbi:MAG: imidazole glycerol phosphate synthase subunit HisF [Bacteroidetes bacterium]|nr:imidazole glycerol phosphate synthase subunit HisF [Bacteroidota bacterium]
MNVAIVDSGVANLASVENAFRTIGVNTERAYTPGDLEKASHLVLPGVGSFEAGMARIRELGLEQTITALASTGKPLLAICLGMQLLSDSSDESPGIRGLGVIRGRCRRLPDSVRVPQLGWNLVKASPSCAVIRTGMAAYANSYALFSAPPGWNEATTEYGSRFIAALERDRILACQFHPELSGDFGLDLIRDWLSPSVTTLTGPSRNGNQIAHIEIETVRSSLAGGAGVRIIPCLDVRDGRVVKGIQFRNLRDAGDPGELAARYEKQGADEIVVLDIAAAPRKQNTRIETVRRVRSRLHIPLTVGGGIRSVGDARRILEAGADKISVNSAAIRNPILLTELADAFGRQCVVCAIDARRTDSGWVSLITGGRERTALNAVTWSRQAESLGAGEILLTSWDRDGTRAGADRELLSAVSTAVRIPVIASGGIGNAKDAAAALRSGASAILAASIFHDEDFVVGDLKKYLQQEGFEVRV